MRISSSSSSHIKVIQKGGRQFLAQICIVTAAYLVIRSDILILDNTVGEYSLTEYYQQTLLFFVVCAFAHIARICPELRHFSVLAAGFFTCMLIRELDAYFDKLVEHGFWFYPAMFVALACLLYAWKEKKG